MIDLIIPHYNNPFGLIRTLKSINKDLFHVVIIDDGSDSRYTSPEFEGCEYWYREANHGPGYTRQQGIDMTKEPYIMFIDAGDIFTSFEVQQNIVNTIIANPQLDFICFPYFRNNEITKETDNRLHGKIYKREFLEKFGITFAPKASYLNEDIGFNRVCRLCGEMTFINLPVIEQIKESNSITEKDNGASLYRDQTRGLALASIHTIEICKKNNIDYSGEMNQIAIALYYWFIRTAAERPEYIKEAWIGAKIFYDKFKEEIKPSQLSVGNAYLKKCLQYRNKINFPINILRFANDIHSKIIPNKYLTIS